MIQNQTIEAVTEKMQEDLLEDLQQHMKDWFSYFVGGIHTADLLRGGFEHAKQLNTDLGNYEVVARPDGSAVVIPDDLGFVSPPSYSFPGVHITFQTGSRPATAEDVKEIQEQLKATASDPNMTIVSHEWWPPTEEPYLVDADILTRDG